MNFRSWLAALASILICAVASADVKSPGGGVTGNSSVTPSNSVALTNKTVTGSTNVLNNINPALDTTPGASLAIGVGAMSNLSTTPAAYQNTAFGYNAMMGASGMTGLTNTAVGWSALSALSSGNNNQAFGWSALKVTTTGSYNDAFGHDALAHNTTGSGNTAMGEGALFQNIAGVDSVAIGDSTLLVYNGSTGTEVAVGYFALSADLTGGGNVAIGQLTGEAITSGNNSVMLGPQTAKNNLTTGGSTVLIGNAVDVPSGQGGTVDAIGIGNGVIACQECIDIGTTAGAAQTGAVVDNVFIGLNAGKTDTTGHDNVIIGPNVGSTNNQTGSNTILIGTSSGIDTPGTAVSNYLSIQNVFEATGTNTPKTGLATITSPTVWGGTTFTVSGCGTAAAVTGNGTAGSFTVGTGASNCVFTVTMNGATGLTAPHGWVLNMDDVTAGIHCINNGAASTTTGTAKCTGTEVTSDLVVFSAAAY